MINFKRFIFLSACIFSFFTSYATRIHGKIVDQFNVPIGFCSITIKQIKKTVLSNDQGIFFLDLQPGKFTFIAQHVGFEIMVIDTLVAGEEMQLNFTMKINSLTLSEVKVKAGGEDPAYEIIRNAIKARKAHQMEIESFTCQAYLKGLIRTADFPDNFLGQPVDFEDGDTAKRKIIFLSESISDIAFRQPDDIRVVVKSTRVSGQSRGLGLANPILISFYNNIVSLPKTFNPRGFISPIADGALAFYRYKYLGVFFENGHQINKIQVIPRRKWEPLFSGYIQIVENEWNIHSVNLSVDKESQLEFADKITIVQQYNPVDNKNWMVGTQTIYPEVNIFGFAASGYFSTIYSNYEINIAGNKKLFGRTVLKFDSLSNKRSEQFWNQARPIPLIKEEVDDFRKKDSLEKRREDPGYLDSLDKIQNRITGIGILINGPRFNYRNTQSSVEMDPLLKSISFNTVEGWVLQGSASFQKNLKGRRQLSFTPVLRYGTSNHHFNASLASNYTFGKKFVSRISLSFGSKVFQFNNANPIPQIMNTVSTLLTGFNYMKLYQAGYFQAGYFKGLGHGLDMDAGINYQNRKALYNTDTTVTWGNKSNLNNITPNYPIEAGAGPMLDHRSLVATIRFRYRPGARYVELPDGEINTFSRSPVFAIQYAKGIGGLFANASTFDKWKMSVTGDLNFKIGGAFKYKIQLGGFFNASQVQLPDYNHFIGNLTRKATPYVESFQVAPFYAFTNKEHLFGELHAEYGLNGMLTNKIPIVKKLNLRIVTGTNLIVLKSKHYQEFFVGIDNILKLVRIDYTRGYGQSTGSRQGIRIGLRGFSSLFNDN